jgi:hypothetical protein
LYCWRFSSAGRSWATDIITPKNHETIASTPSPITTNARRSFLSRGRPPRRGGGGPGGGGRLGVPRHGGLIPPRRSRGAVVTPSPSPSLSARRLSPARMPPSRNPLIMSRARSRISVKTEEELPSAWRPVVRRALDRARRRLSRAASPFDPPGSSPKTSSRANGSRGERSASGSESPFSPRSALRRSLAISLRRVAIFEGAGVKRVKSHSRSGAGRLVGTLSPTGPSTHSSRQNARASLPRRARAVSLALAR